MGKSLGTIGDGIGEIGYIEDVEDVRNGFS